MFFEEVVDTIILNKISPELTCTCDEFHECQQCHEDRKNESELNSLENQSNE
jgi:hypothetical protein